MGAWGSDIFENDEAGDFADNVAEANDFSMVQQALEAVLSSGDELEAPTGTEGLAAADLVARLRGNFGKRSGYTERFDKWAETSRISPDDETVRKAIAVVDRIRTAPSELLELWEDVGAEEWLAHVEALRQRLESPSQKSPVAAKSSRSVFGRFLGRFGK